MRLSVLPGRLWFRASRLWFLARDLGGRVNDPASSDISRGLVARLFDDAGFAWTNTFLDPPRFDQGFLLVIKNKLYFPHSVFQGMKFVGDGSLHILVALRSGCPVAVLSFQSSRSEKLKSIHCCPKRFAAIEGVLGDVDEVPGLGLGDASGFLTPPPGAAGSYSMRRYYPGFALTVD
ncbi:MAG: hypothetical protein IID48_16375 [Proteobacteria bacterium]|nr:hypothetical protein [Pseudomonadota bacterium]